MTATRSATGVVVTGHGVASGRSGDPRFPSGTLGLQFPIFARLGVGLDDVHPGTINVELDHGPIDLDEPDHHLPSVKWHDEMPPEDFSLWRVSLIHAGRTWPALVYRPHPETKPEHHQPADVVEILAPLIPDLAYGDRVTVGFDRPHSRAAGTDPHKITD
jgi:hypothetical protein